MISAELLHRHDELTASEPSVTIVKGEAAVASRAGMVGSKQSISGEAQQVSFSGSLQDLLHAVRSAAGPTHFDLNGQVVQVSASAQKVRRPHFPSSWVCVVWRVHSRRPCRRLIVGRLLHVRFSSYVSCCVSSRCKAMHLLKTGLPVQPQAYMCTCVTVIHRLAHASVWRADPCAPFCRHPAAAPP